MDSRGWCLSHYMRWRRHGDPERGGDLTRQSTTGHPCTVDGCSRPVVARDICERHYRRWKRYGDPTAGRVSPGAMTVVERFWSKVDKTDTCWLWTDEPNGAGYGTFTVGPVRDMAHRWVLAFEGQPVPDGMEVDHLCFTRLCVRPDHLEIVTGVVNKERARLRAS